MFISAEYIALFQDAVLPLISQRETMNDCEDRDSLDVEIQAMAHDIFGQFCDALIEAYEDCPTSVTHFLYSGDHDVMFPESWIVIERKFRLFSTTRHSINPPLAA